MNRGSSRRLTVPCTAARTAMIRHYVNLARMADRARAWGVQPTYVGYRGDVVEAPPDSVAAIIESMAGGRDRPPLSKTADHEGTERCWPPPEREWGWAVQLYAARSRESWGVGDLADLRRLGRWARGAGASVLL